MSLDELKDLESDLVTLEKKDTQTRAKDYIPNGKAEEFIKLVGSNEHFVNMFVGANGTSKTATGANLIANIVYGPQNEYFNHTLFKEWPYIKRGRIISDPTTLKEKIIPELQKWLPLNDSNQLPDATYQAAKEGKNYVSKFTTNNGWEIDLMSNEQDVKEFESVDLGFVWIDEPMPKDRFMATLARGRQGMTVFWTFTPLTYSAWIKEWMDTNVGELADYVEAEMEDNCELHGVRGVFKHAHIKRIADSYPEDEKQARVFGKFGHLIGRVHKRFKRSVHVIKPFKITERDFTCYMALDPHPRVPDHVMWMAVDKKGTKYVVAELLSEGLVREMRERILSIEESRNLRIETRIIDPAGYVDDQHREENSIGIQLQEMGMSFIKGSKDLMAGIKRTDDALNYELKEGKMFRSPEVYVFDTCPITIKQVEEYVWADYRGSSKDEKQPMGRPRDINDHMPENLHRLLLHEPTFIPYEMRGGGHVEAASSVEDYDPYK